MIMKRLKFTLDQVEGILNHKYYKTWRLLDDKKLDIDDEIELIDSQDGHRFANAVVDSITIKHLRDIDDLDKIGHFEYTSQDEMYSIFKKYYGPKIGPDSIVKIIVFHLIDKASQASVQASNTVIHEVKMFTDGGSRGNPGPSATGYAILDMEDNVIYKSGQYLGITTNNQAEYQAVRQGLEYCKKLNISTVHAYLDSLLVVNQLNGIYKIKNRDLWPIHESIKKLIGSFKHVKFTHVPREFNTIADGMVNKTLDEQDVNGRQSQLL